MSELIKVIILGIVEGLTEFIPVSSTGHLILVGEWINFVGEKAVSFEIFIQIGAILAVVVLYLGRFIDLFRSFFVQKEIRYRLNYKHIALSIFPVVCVGFFLYRTIRGHLFSPLYVACALIVVGIIMIIIDWVYGDKAHTHELDHITYKQAFLIGCFQCFAVWPGVSRSGATIIGARLCGLSYTVAAEFSFIIAVPVMFLATGYDLMKSFSMLTVGDTGYFLMGCFISFIVAIFAIRSFLVLLKKLKLAPFGIYRIIIGIVVLCLLR